MVPVYVRFTEGIVQTNNQGCYVVGNGAKQGQLKETEALPFKPTIRVAISWVVERNKDNSKKQKQIEMLEKQRSVVTWSQQWLR